jgi:uncharacterized protein YfdQ (DUF2303 family)
MKEFITAITAAFAKPFEKIDEKKYVVHRDYLEKEFPKPVHYKEPIARNVIDQGVVNKDDFVMFVNEYKTQATKIFYDEDKVKAVFNYSTPDEADYGDSTCRMPLIYTEDFYDYYQKTGKPISQKDFVRFLKRMEPFIVALDNKQAAAMDIIEMAENLQGITQVDSIQRNTSNKFTIDATVRTGKSNMTIPRIITFEFPIFKNDRGLVTRFETELFLTAQEGAFVAELLCYNTDQLIEEARRQITTSICDQIDGVSAYAI